ncbi:MAG: DUF5615 family PIN-like protein [Spirosoma sp.]|nr:DUF5615 family PIN-like protein [Spirosoma sp.]
MTFLIDEQLPRLLADWLQEKGYDAIHVSALLTDSRISDEFICEQSMLQERTVITKDSDFINTYIVKRQPYKLVYITTGNLRNRPLLDLFRSSFTQLLMALEEAQVIELNQHMLKIWF